MCASCGINGVVIGNKAAETNERTKRTRESFDFPKKYRCNFPERYFSAIIRAYFSFFNERDKLPCDESIWKRMQVSR